MPDPNRQTTDFSPLRYRPTDPHLGRWQWDHEEDEDGLFNLSERHGRPVANIRMEGRADWRAGLAGDSARWQARAGGEVAARAAELLGRQYETARSAADAAERAAALMAIGAGVAPDPANVTIAFLLGKTRHPD